LRAQVTADEILFVLKTEACVGDAETTAGLLSDEDATARKRAIADARAG